MFGKKKEDPEHICLIFKTDNETNERAFKGQVSDPDIAKVSEITKRVTGQSPHTITKSLDQFATFTDDEVVDFVYKENYDTTIL